MTRDVFEFFSKADVSGRIKPTQISALELPTLPHPREKVVGTSPYLPRPQTPVKQSIKAGKQGAQGEMVRKPVAAHSEAHRTQPPQQCLG